MVYRSVDLDGDNCSTSGARASKTEQRINREATLTRGLRDMYDGVFQWRPWFVLAVNDIRMRYRRSRLGQFWLTLSMAVSIFGMSLVFSGIMQMPMKDYLLFLGVGMIVWNLISSTLGELATCVISSEIYLKSYPGPRSTVVNRVIMKSLIVNAHNFAILPVIWLLTGFPISWSVFLVIPGLLLAILNFYWFGLLLGPFCARFRDVPQIIQSVLQLMFFLTPVMYRPDHLKGELAPLINYNPFASAVDLLRSPLIGQVPETRSFVIVAIVTVLGFALAVPSFARFRARLVYWL